MSPLYAVKKANLLLKEAYNSFKKGRYEESSVLLEKYCDSTTRDPFPYLLLAISYLQTNKLITAQSTLKKMIQVDPEYVPGVQLQAYLYMKAAPDMKSVMSYYVDLLGKFSHDSGIRKGISVLRKVDDFSEFQRNAKLFDFVKIPKNSSGFFSFRNKNHNKNITSVYSRRKKRNFNFKKVIIPAVVIFSAVLLAVALYVYHTELHVSSIGEHFANSNRNNNFSETIDQITVDGSGFSLIEKIVKRRTPEFYYSSDVLLRDFRRAKLLIKAGRYNDALSILNRITHSNANHSVRERSEFLKRFIINIDEREWQKIDYNDIKKKPYLYTGYSVEWTGKTANVIRRDGKLIFNLLVDYRSDNVFSGIVDIYSEHNYTWMKNGEDISIRAVIVSTVGSEQRLYLSAKDIEKK